MPRILAAITFCLAASLPAQPVLDREQLRRIPPEQAVVLDVSGDWVFGHTQPDVRQDDALEVQTADGCLRLRVSGAGKEGFWHRRLAVPFDVVRYPIVFFAYRATGIMPGNASLLQLPCVQGPTLGLLQDADVIADGAVHEIVMDLREADARGRALGLSLNIHCRGPEPAVFELLGLRFEADGEAAPLEPKKGAELSLRVVDHDGKPVAGASVIVDGERLNGSCSGETDGDGRVALCAVANAADAHGVRIAKAGMAPIMLIASQRQKLPETATLLRASPYGGVVQNETGQPVSDATVSIVVYTEAPMWFGRPCRAATVHADANGAWRTPDLPIEGVLVQVTIEHPDYAGGQLAAPPLADMQAGRAVLTIPSGSCLRGRVVDPDGNPVPALPVVLTKNEYDNTGMKTVKTGADGRFAFGKRMAGRRILSMIPEGFAPVGFPVQITGGMDELTIQLTPGRPLRGRVVDCDGKPIPEVNVSTNWACCMFRSPWVGRTDAEGRFVWPHAPEGGPVWPYPGSGAPSLTLQKKGYTILCDCTLAAGDEEQTITLPSVLKVSGTVRDAATGEPIPNCTVVPGSASVDNHGGHLAPYWNKDKEHKSADGTYEFVYDMSSPGDLKAVKATTEGYEAGMVSGIPLTAGDHHADIRLRRGTAWEGTVLLPDGKPASGAEVVLLEQGGNMMIFNGHASDAVSVTTGTDGRYRFASVPGDCLLVAMHPAGFARIDKATRALSPDLPLRPWGGLVGVIRNGDRPVANTGVSVQVLTDQSEGKNVDVYYNLSCQTDADGCFRFDRIPPDRGCVHVFQSTPDGGPYGRARQTAYHVPPGGTAHVFLGGTGRPVMGRVVLPEGRTAKDGTHKGYVNLAGTPDVPLVLPVPEQFLGLAILEQRHQLLAWLKTPAGKAYLAALPPLPGDKDEPSFALSEVLASDGSFRIDDVPAGTYRLKISSSAPALGYPTQQLDRAIQVPEAPTETLDLGTLPWDPPK